VNILVSDDIHALLCDFGLDSLPSASASIDWVGVHALRFQSPEHLLEGGAKTFTDDVWAFGMTIYQVRYPSSIIS